MKVTVDIPGAFIPQDHPLALLAQDYTEAITGRRWETAGAGPANEGYMLIGAGIPTLCGFGPTGGNPHAPDEWVEINSLPATVSHVCRHHSRLSEFTQRRKKCPILTVTPGWT